MRPGTVSSEHDTLQVDSPAVTDGPRDRARDDIHAALPDGCRVALPLYDSGRHARTVVARSPQPLGRRGRREYIEGRGEDALGALTYLVMALQERCDGTAYGSRTGREGPLAYLDGAESASRQSWRPGLTDHELARVIDSKRLSSRTR
jgi:hypothetical protein